MPSKTSKKITTRKSPSDSATHYKLGTKKVGNDGKMWIITETVSGIKRWMPYRSEDAGVTIKNGIIQSFNFKKISSAVKKKPVRIGHLDITSNIIGAGESIFTIYNTKKGRYNIYYFDYSLIAIHESESLMDQQFKLQKGNAGCDYGMFAFSDYKRVEPYIKPNKKKTKIFPSIDFGISPGRGKKYPNYIYLYESDIRASNPIHESNDPIAMFAVNGTGDGFFYIYKGGNAFLIMSRWLEEDILDRFS